MTSPRLAEAPTTIRDDNVRALHCTSERTLHIAKLFARQERSRQFESGPVGFLHVCRRRHRQKLQACPHCALTLGN